MIPGALQRRGLSQPRRQSGVVLLAFILILIVGSSYMLLSRLNEHTQTYARDIRTQTALNDARRALLAYAMNYPELRSNAEKGPGFLPCPFIDDDDETPTEVDDVGLPESNCSVGAGTTIGRLPFRILGLHDLRDSAGERLWYALSDNFKNVQSDDTVMNSETPGLLSVDGAGDVVAVVIAPGVPVTGQAGRSADPKSAGFAAVSNYLEGLNATGGGAAFATTDAGEFNDRVITITRAELMEVVERRVVNEIRAALAAYHGARGSYPWLAPFTDPKAEFQGFSGTHDGANGAASLTDTGRDFVNDLGVQNGDLVRNLADGSIALVTGVAATTLTLGTLSMGTDNDFDTGDEYQVLPALPWIASAGSSGALLVDDTRDFGEIGIAAGDVVDNITDGTSGIVASYSGSQITVTGSVDFAPGDSYIIRSGYGQATGANNISALKDSNRNFIDLGVQPGTLVVNLSKGSIGRVETVAAGSLTTSGMSLGAENDFDAGDFYYLPRLNTDGATREGHLSIHEYGKHFATGFTMESNLGIAPSTTTAATYQHGTYVANLEAAAAAPLSSATITSAEGQCVWTGDEAEAYCLAGYPDPDFPILGTVTSGTNSSTLTDGNADFISTGVKRGDLVANFDDEVSTGISGTATAGASQYMLEDTSKNFVTLGITPYFSLVHNNDDGNRRALVTEVIDTATLRLAQFQDGDTVNFEPGHDYAVYTPQLMVVVNVNSATQLTTSRLMSTPDFDDAAGGASGSNPEFYRIFPATGLTPTRYIDENDNTTLVDAGADFSEVQPGDVVENLVDDAFGLITSVDAANDSLTAQLYNTSGATRMFNAGEDYRIYYNHDVVRRIYELRPRFSGTAFVYTASTQRARDVCLGSNDDCQTLTQDVALPAMPALVTVRDLDSSNSEVARTEINVAAGELGNIKVSGLDYYFSEASGELPAWFIKNRWHEFVYVAASSELTATGSGTCLSGTNCLTLTSPHPVANPSTHTDRQAIIVAAGSTLSGAPCEADPSQDRTRARLCDYYEDENSGATPDVFAAEFTGDTFNDQVTSIAQ